MSKRQKTLDFFIRQTAKAVMVNESIVDIIIRDQWKQLLTKSRDFVDMEISEIGTVMPYYYKVVKRLYIYEKSMVQLLGVIVSKLHKGVPVSALLMKYRSMYESYIYLKEKTHELINKNMEK